MAGRGRDSASHRSQKQKSAAKQRQGPKAHSGSQDRRVLDRRGPRDLESVCVVSEAAGGLVSSARQLPAPAGAFVRS
jgi:hypothetical protein